MTEQQEVNMVGAYVPRHISQTMRVFAYLKGDNISNVVRDAINFYLKSQIDEESSMWQDAAEKLKSDWFFHKRYQEPVTKTQKQLNNKFDAFIKRNWEFLQNKGISDENIKHIFDIFKILIEDEENPTE